MQSLKISLKWIKVEISSSIINVEMDTLQLIKLLKADPATAAMFGGVLARDELPLLTNNKCYVCNTDNSSGPGNHWIAIYVENNKGEYGLPPLKEFEVFLSNNTSKWIFNDKQLQSFDSLVCGEYCVVYLMLRCRGVSLKTFGQMFSHDLEKNDRLIANLPTLVVDNTKLTINDCSVTQQCKAYNCYNYKFI